MTTSENVYFESSTEKIVEAVGVLLNFEENSEMGYLRLLKLLYIADRESLKETGKPIIGTLTVAMNYGPLHSRVYSLINGEHMDSPVWNKHIHRDGYKVHLTSDPGVMALSRYEIHKLNEVSEAYFQTDDFDIAHETHEFEEWLNFHQEGTSTPIPFESIIEAVGLTNQKNQILDQARQSAYISKIFSK